MTTKQLFEQIKKKKSFLIVGLDSDIEKIPAHLKTLSDPIFEFNKQIIDATHDLCVGYKPNTAFYESLGSKGWQSLEKTINYINQKDKNLFTIADAKRGDIGNTSKLYARAFFEQMNFNSVTVAPYMGEDSVTPFLGYNEKFVILLALTSNKGAEDFQMRNNLYQDVLHASQKWANAEQMMYVVGATKATMLADIRKIIPDHFLLVPGVGAQGGSLEEVVKYGMNKQCGLLVNSSRNIIYASSGSDFAEAARKEAQKMQVQMAQLLTI